MLRSTRLSRSKRLSAASLGPPPIEIRERGEAVEILQQALIDLGYTMPNTTRETGLADGIFGAETKSAVIAFQKREQLQPDGLVGPKTLRRLDDLIFASEARGKAEYLARVATPVPNSALSGS
jgi:peptidoglycan hydrolase-like protein with peptidoglycan-binding domain